MENEPACPIRERCGGCPAMALPPEAQRAQHLELLRRGLGREPDLALESPRPMGYRARVSFTVGPDGRPGYRAPGSHEPVPVERCPIAREELNAALAEILRLTPDLRPLSRLELRSDGARVVLAAESKRPDAARALLNTLPFDSALEGRAVRGDPGLTLRVAGVEHRVSPGSFYQVNLELNEQLVQQVRAAVLAAQPTRVLDLYAGIGNLSLPLAAAGVAVTMIESEPSAVRDARATAARLGLQVQILQQDVGRLRAGEHFFDVALLDPPRAGAPGIIERLLLTRPKAIVVVSCNPYTLARDIQPARRAGYTLRTLMSFDMFPQTGHLEALCVLTRG